MDVLGHKRAIHAIVRPENLMLLANLWLVVAVLAAALSGQLRVTHTHCDFFTLTIFCVNAGKPTFPQKWLPLIVCVCVCM